MSTTDVKIKNGHFNCRNNAIISNEGDIYMGLDWSQIGIGTHYSGNGWIWFDGNVDQFLNSTSYLTIPKLRVDNGQNLILQSSIAVSTVVDLMNNGNIELGNNNLIVSPGAVINNYDLNNFIQTNGNGILQQEVGASNVFFPVGNISYTPLILQNSATTDNFRVRVQNHVFDEGISGTQMNTDLVDKTWMIEEEIPGGSDVSMTLQWNSSDELPSFDRSNCGIAHHISGTLWDNPSYTSSVSSGTAWQQTRNGFTSFSPFVVRGPTVILTMELLTFDAYRKDADHVVLNWSTAFEQANKGFEIQRMLDNETEFATIDFVESQGNTNNSYDYLYTDNNTYSGISYYRLKQIDLDMNYQYSEIKAVDGIKGTMNVNTYPNPVNDELLIKFNNLAEEIKTVSISITDVTGRILYKKRQAVNYTQLISINYVINLIPAVYMLNIDLDNGDRIVRKFIKTK
jgi:hypothetical protein